MKIAIAGGTGTVGKHVVVATTTAGHETVILTRATGTDLITGTGLTAALQGVDVVIDVSATSSLATRESVHFFGTVTSNLLRAERAVGVKHHIALSIVGAAKVNANYYAGKAVQEKMLHAESGGWSLLRTTQFHEFTQQLVQHGKVGPFQVVPTIRSQPIAAAEVADELVSIAAGDPRGLEPDLAGPQEERMADLVKRLLRAEGNRKPVIQIPLPGRWGRGMRDGSLLPAPGTRRGRETFAQWLESRDC
ncbi:3-beta hydroxysteroid dehydrogenase [Herbiconiux sp. CPCC 205716]|uniref:3-beta hydroxysteroid dehydrogenase n=1 Tax=Herbiconiux gentiana TaxID=2970912 RepID=A0ABT2GAJ4_9MICO|nr:3-beta hydroxysteroid dehydrogenase [Herbiconiux gentiana]MCS5713208.1 3-beta hydroxysteroid dehydrogenase [Herbiconiux gentiana]